MYLDCLNRNQIKVLKKLGFLREYRFYLAGGTALVFQLTDFHKISWSKISLKLRKIKEKSSQIN